MNRAARRALIVTADDFGLSLAVNDAVEMAHREGILTAASLMVTGEAAADAVQRARRLPSLRVGLHLALVEARPALPVEAVPALVDATGHFRRDMAASGARMFFDSVARRQLEAEVEAQFAAFDATGLVLDHVNAHKHFHMHPTILSAAMKAGGRRGLRAIRLPIEDRATVNAVEPGTTGLSHRLFAGWAMAQGRRITRAGFATPDRVIGLAWSGAMDAARVAAALKIAPAGITELYTHPATLDAFPGSAPGYRYRDELAALVSPDVKRIVAEGGFVTGGYADFCSS